jgi:hypothetical protein
VTADPEMMRVLGFIESGVKNLNERFDEHRDDIKALQVAMAQHEALDEKRFNFLRGAGAVIAVIWGAVLAFGSDVFKVLTGK